MKNRKHIILFFIFLTISLVYSFSADNNIPSPEKASSKVSPDSKDPATLLGLTLTEVHSLFGVPDEISVFRDQNPEYDNVVYFYKKYEISLLWFENHVWVVRFDNRSKENVFGIAPGMKKEDVLKTLKFKYQEIDDSVIFFLEDRGFPVRLRIYFTKNEVSDIYLYRGDF